MTDANTALAQDLGRLERRDGRAVLTYTRRLPQPPPVVWRALTEPDHLDAWFPTTIDGDRAPGAALRFAFRDMEAPPMEGEMLVFEPPSVMEFRWGPDALRFEVQSERDGSVLVLTAVLEELGKAARDGAGWHACLDRLVEELGGDSVAAVPADRWRELREPYVKHFGPEASTIGPPQEWERAHGSEAAPSG
jgi:uncharacterized protein YndB with AHSA1/START domain